MKQYLLGALICACQPTSWLCSLPFDTNVHNKIQTIPLKEQWLFMWVMEGLEPENCFKKIISDAVDYEEKISLQTRYFRYLCYQLTNYSKLIYFFEFLRDDNAPLIITQCTLPKKKQILKAYKLPLSKKQQNEERIWLQLLKKQNKNLTDLKLTFK